MIIESGVIIFAGLLLLFIKLPRLLALRLLGQPLALDLVVSVVAYILHWGTFSGVMAAAVAGLMCSGFTAVARWAMGYSKGGKAVPFTTKFADMFALAQARGNRGDFELPAALVNWRKQIGDAAFNQRFANLPVDFVSTNDITGGNSGSATLNRRLEIVGLIFDGNEEAMASDWAYSEGAGRALSTDIRFALTIAREVHGAGWIVDELTAGK